MAIFVHYGEIKYSTIMVWYFSSTNTANTNQSGLSVKLNSALPVLPRNTSCRNVTLSQFVCFVCFCFLFFCFFFFLDKRSERAIIIIHSHNELNITVNQHSILIYTGVTANCASLKSIHIISPWFLKKTITLNSFQINFISQNFLNQFIYFFHKFLCHI